MRSDVLHYYSAPIDKVYSAYKLAIQKAFKKDADGTPLLNLAFGLSFSFKYNMNGGGCNVHFLSHNDGTAVDVHYTIAQAFGAKYRAHDRDMTVEVEKILGVSATNIEIDIEEFEKKQLQLSNNSETSSSSFSFEKKQEAPTANFCSKCGTPFAEAALFCSNCGAKRE